MLLSQCAEFANFTVNILQEKQIVQLQFSVAEMSDSGILVSFEELRLRRRFNCKKETIKITNDADRSTFIPSVLFPIYFAHFITCHQSYKHQQRFR